MLKRFMNGQTESSNLSRSRKAEEIRKQMARHRRNLISICRLTIQSLKEKSMYNSIDDNSEEFLNFATILEHILSHRLKGEATWFRLEEPRDFWDFIYVACRSVPNNCLQSIHMMEDFRSSRVKGRAWIRAVLMEKRLSEYIIESMQDERLLKIFYGEGSFMRSEESQILRECLQDLNLVDFSFCLKGSTNLQTGVARIVDYTPYLSCSERLTGSMQQRAMDVDISLLAVQEDEDQLGDQSLEQQLQNLKSKYTSVCDQKRYLEERLQASNDQLNDAMMQVKIAQETVKKIEERSKRERLQLENVIIELQDQIGCLKDAHLASRKELEEHLTTGHWHLRRDNSGQAIAMDYVTMNTGSSSIDTGADGVSLQSLEPPTSPSQISPTSSNSLTLLLGKRVDERPVRETKEETPSLVPLAGSFTSQFSVKSNDNVFTSSTSSSANLQDGHASQTLPKLSESGSISSAVSLADSLLSTVSAPP